MLVAGKEFETSEKFGVRIGYRLSCFSLWREPASHLTGHGLRRALPNAAGGQKPCRKAATHFKDERTEHLT